MSTKILIGNSLAEVTQAVINEIPISSSVDLENFVTKVEQTVYSSMTINEVEKFYS